MGIGRGGPLLRVTQVCSRAQLADRSGWVLMLRTLDNSFPENIPAIPQHQAFLAFLP